MSLRDLLDSRRSEIEAQLKALRAELEDIRIAVAAISGAPPGPVARGPGRPSRNEIKPGSIKDWVLKALQDEPDGLETEEIIVKIGLLGGPKIVRNSMTPQLSRLKADDNKITLEGKRWKLLPPLAEPEFSSSFGAGSAPDWQIKGAELI